MSDGIDPLDETAAEPGPAPKSTERKRIGPYELISKLGEGGMGVVWRAHDPKLDRHIAIKVLKRDDAPQSLRQRLQREARAMARLKHENVLTVYDSGTEGDRDYIAMELVEGASLDQWLEAQPPEREVIDAMLAAGRGLAAAHRAGLVHRDFKPHNVLRSAQGRVMVTDFGLARGLGEETVVEQQLVQSNAEVALDVTLTPDATGSKTPSLKSKTDSVLDVPLTQTGVLIGTPAYMAPEQFEGAAPDPRTDQFAFCVTAWQMLTGGRPFTGGSIAEIQLAAAEGAAHVKTSLAPLIRMALVRGLEPEPKKRWPDMDALLDELERATRPKRPPWVIPMLALVVLGLVVGAFAIARRGRVPASAGRPCEPADVAFGNAWSPDLHSTLRKQLTSREPPVPEAVFARIADPFDAWRDTWMRSYDEACRAAPDKLPRARLSCLLAARDNMAALSLVVGEAPTPALSGFDAYGILPNLAVCNGKAPVMQPYAPTEKRAEITALMGRALALRGAKDVLAASDELMADVKKASWQPLEPLVLAMTGNALMRDGKYAKARAVYTDALVGTRTSNDVRLQGILRSDLVEVSFNELAQPTTPIKPHELPTEIGKLLDAARATAKAAGEDPILLAVASQFEARAWAARAKWTHDKDMYANAVAAIHGARERFTEIGDLGRAAEAAVDEAQIVLARGDDRALDDAVFAARTAEDALERAKLERRWDLGEIQAQVAFARGEFAAAAQRYATLGPRPEPPGVALAFSGRVTNAEGAPASGATVIIWDGELHGDPSSLVTDDRELVGERVTADADGTFTIHGHATSAVIAQWKTERSAPMQITAAITLHTAAAQQPVNGTASGDWRGEVDAFARYDIDANHWFVRAPVRRDHAFTLTGLPPGKTTLGLSAEVGDGERTVLAAGTAAGKVVEIAWPSGPPIEIVARGPLTAHSYAYVLPVQAELPGSPEMLDQAALTASSVATCALHAIGSDATPGGKDIYELGDRHCVLANNLNAKLTVCITGDGTEGDGHRTVCAPVEVTAPPHDTPTEPAVVLLNTSPANDAPLK